MGGEGAVEGDVTEGGAGEPRNAAAACSMPSPPDAALTRKPRALLPPPAGVETHAPPTERRAAVPMVRDAVVHAAPARRGVLGGGAALADDEGGALAPLGASAAAAAAAATTSARGTATGDGGCCRDAGGTHPARSRNGLQRGGGLGGCWKRFRCGRMPEGGAAVTAGASPLAVAACLAGRRSPRDTMSSSRASTRAGSDMTEPTASATESLAMT